ncbi:unnamed protein product [Peronospora effusa]|nr:unnamed protein product [Peronospora effusa]
MFNVTDISYGVYGNNKFYMRQLIVNHGVFVVFRKLGQVGAKSPQSQTERFNILVVTLSVVATYKTSGTNKFRKCKVRRK